MTGGVLELGRILGGGRLTEMGGGRRQVLRWYTVSRIVCPGVRSKGTRGKREVQALNTNLGRWIVTFQEKQKKMGTRARGEWEKGARKLLFCWGLIWDMEGKGGERGAHLVVSSRSRLNKKPKMEKSH